MSTPDERALDCMIEATTDAGILASTREERNYRRIWCRDGIIAGLAGLVAGHSELVRGLRETLRTLARAQGLDGEIPSNVQVEEGEPIEVSYGGRAGRVDTQAWFVIGLVEYVEQTGYPSLGAELEEPARRALAALRSWEFNRRDLVYTPEGGHWADEYFLRGYVLEVQCLRLWAQRRFAEFTGESKFAEHARRLERQIAGTFWPSEEADAESSYHPLAFRRFADEHGEVDHWLASLTPGGYLGRFDAWANALATLLEVGDPEQHASALEHGEQLRRETPRRLIPAFSPPVTEEDPEWESLHNNRGETFSNHPGRYHNGGLWPVVNGFWGMALTARNRNGDAEEVLERIRRVDSGEAADAEFPEYLDASDGSAGGIAPCTWSAAGEVLLSHALEGDTLSFD